jgi:hypothetical protein
MLGLKKLWRYVGALGYRSQAANTSLDRVE